MVTEQDRKLWVEIRRALLIVAQALFIRYIQRENE
jgi:hypothetical protein